MGAGDTLKAFAASVGFYIYIYIAQLLTLAAMEEEGLTEYELERVRRVEQNNEKLAEIGVPRLSTLIRAPPAVKRSRPKKRPTVRSLFTSLICLS